jgi:hypothetical protein
MQTTHEKLTTFVEVSHKKYDTHAYAVGYLSSMVSGMIDEMRTRGTKDTIAMADYYDHLLSQSIIKTLTEK